MPEKFDSGRGRSEERETDPSKGEKSEAIDPKTLEKTVDALREKEKNIMPETSKWMEKGKGALVGFLGGTRNLAKFLGLVLVGLAAAGIWVVAKGTEIIADQLGKRIGGKYYENFVKKFGKKESKKE